MTERSLGGAEWRSGLAGEAAHQFVEEFRMRFPRLRGDHFAVAHALFGAPGAARHGDVPLEMRVAGDALALEQIGRGQNLDAVADRENPLALFGEVAGEVEEV